MVPVRKQTAGRIIRTGWSDAGGSLTASVRADVAASSALSARTRTLLGILLLLAALSVLLPGAIWRSSDPEEAAREYLDALVSGDLEALRPHLAPGDGALDVALAPEVLAATSGRVEAYTIDAVAISGSNALVTVTLDSGSTTARTTLALRARVEGAFVAVRWELVPVELPVLDLAPFTGTTELLLNGQAVNIPVSGLREGLLLPEAITLRVLPGTYVISLPPMHAPLVPRARTVAVPPRLGAWRSGLVDVGYDLAAVGEHAATQTIQDTLAYCSRETSPHPLGCPFSVDLPAGAHGSWRILNPPVVQYLGMVTGPLTFSGRGLVAEFTEAPAEVGAPAVSHRVTVDFGAFVAYREGGYEVDRWNVIAQRATLR